MIFTKEELKDLMKKGKKIYEIIEIKKCSITTVIKYLKKYNIKYNKGFYSRGLKVGRPGGFTYTESQKKEMSEKVKGEKNHFFGKKHSLKTKKLMSKNHADFKGGKNPFKQSIESDENKRKEHKERCQKLWDNRDKEWRRIFSEKLSKSTAESDQYKNKRYHKNHKSGHLLTKKGGRIFYRSSWEKIFAEYLDIEDLVFSFSLESLTLPYIDSNNRKRYTRIDFLIILENGERSIVEIKPESLLDYNQNRFKMIGHKEYCKEKNIQYFHIGKDIILDIEKMKNLIKEINDGEHYVD